MLSLCLKNINNTTISSNNLSIEDVDCKNKIIPETKTVLKLAIAETLVVLKRERTDIPKKSSTMWLVFRTWIISGCSRSLAIPMAHRNHIL